MLEGKSIVVGVTGGIAAYKAVEVVSRLKKLGSEISVVMTESATKFVTPLTFQTLSRNRVFVDMFAEPKDWHVQHVSLADRADLCLVVPATANIIGKLANGIADDLLSTTLMATTAPVMLAPAMNVHMYENPVVQQNIARLKGLGYRLIEPSYGRLAEGYEGKGRLPEPEEIVREVVNLLNVCQDFCGKTILVTAGPTKEAIDPVRYITNHSTGKMGYAIAASAVKRGAKVILVSGTRHLTPPPGVKPIYIESTLEMYRAVMDHFDQVDIVIKAAAVADYRPLHVAEQKIKRADGNLQLELTRNPDILYELGQRKTKQILVGFAAETNNLLEHAREKMAKKNLDLIVANDLCEEGAGFGTDTNIVKLITRNGAIESLPKMSKQEVADRILDKVQELINFS